MRGTFEDKGGLVGDFVVQRQVIRQSFGMRDDFLEFVAVRPGADPKAVQARAERMLEAAVPDRRGAEPAGIRRTASPATSTSSCS